MKTKMALCLVVLLLVVASCCLVCAENGSIEGIPQKVVELLAAKGVDKQTLEDYINIGVVEAPIPLNHLFVLASKDGTHHTVYHFTNSESDENSHLSWKPFSLMDYLIPMKLPLMQTDDLPILNGGDAE